jgi:hypothetical protein
MAPAVATVAPKAQWRIEFGMACSLLASSGRSANPEKRAATRAVFFKVLQAGK